jgi:NAD(P)-dependent dehydrogenase (short-subunit alcohol dehydrogenase family)
MFSLQQKTAAITGGGSGIGKAVAEVFAQQGAEVFILDLNKSAAEEVAKAIQAKGGKAHAMDVNVADHKQTKDVVAAIAQQAGRVDILVNSAGVSHIGRLDNTTEEDFDRVFNVNVKGVYNMMQAVIYQMKQQRYCKPGIYS